MYSGCVEQKAVFRRGVVYQLHVSGLIIDGDEGVGN
jgi:hypothetical protein